MDNSARFVTLFNSSFLAPSTETHGPLMVNETANLPISFTCFHFLVCNKHYVVETGVLLGERVNHHRSAIRNNHTDSALSIYFDMHLIKSDKNLLSAT